MFVFYFIDDLKKHSKVIFMKVMCQERVSETMHEAVKQMNKHVSGILNRLHFIGGYFLHNTRTEPFHCPRALFK